MSPYAPLLAGLGVVAVGLAVSLVVSTDDATERADRGAAPSPAAATSPPSVGRVDPPGPGSPAPAPGSDPEDEEANDARPKTPTPHQMRAAEDFQRLYGDWDQAVLDELLSAEIRGDGFRERLDWFRSVVGDCDGPPEVMSVASKRQARFRFGCEEGTLELGVNLDRGGRVEAMRTGVRGKEPPDRVRSAALGAFALIDEWNEERFHQLFVERFDTAERG